MPSEENIADQQQLLATYRRTLAHYLRLRAELGSAHTPPNVAYGILEARNSIAQIKSALRRWNVQVEDLPDDSDEDIATLQERLIVHRRTLAHLLVQASQYGGEAAAPLVISNSIHEAREQISHIKSILRSLQVPAEDLPGDSREVLTDISALEEIFGDIDTYIASNSLKFDKSSSYYKERPSLVEKYLIVIFNLLSIVVTVSLAIIIYPQLSGYQVPLFFMGVVVFSTIFLYISASSYREIKVARLEYIKILVAKGESGFYWKIDRDISAILEEEAD